jgi:hypothetical protein
MRRSAAARIDTAEDCLRAVQRCDIVCHSDEVAVVVHKVPGGVVRVELRDIVVIATEACAVGSPEESIELRGHAVRHLHQVRCSSGISHIRLGLGKLAQEPNHLPGSE